MPSAFDLRAPVAVAPGFECSSTAAGSQANGAGGRAPGGLAAMIAAALLAAAIGFAAGGLITNVIHIRAWRRFRRDMGSGGMWAEVWRLVECDCPGICPGFGLARARGKALLRGETPPDHVA